MFLDLKSIQSILSYTLLEYIIHISDVNEAILEELASILSPAPRCRKGRGPDESAFWFTLLSVLKISDVIYELGLRLEEVVWSASWSDIVNQTFCPQNSYVIYTECGRVIQESVVFLCYRDLPFR